jgi:hypothetical protein
MTVPECFDYITGLLEDLLAGQPDYLIIVDDKDDVVLVGTWHVGNPGLSPKLSIHP